MTLASPSASSRRVVTSPVVFVKADPPGIQLVVAVKLPLMVQNRDGAGVRSPSAVLAVMVTVPVDTGVTTPSDTVATVSSLEVR